MSTNPRAEVQRKIEEGDLYWLLLKTGELHGHFCPFVALGGQGLGHRKAFTEGIDEDTRYCGDPQLFRRRGPDDNWLHLR